MFPFDADSLDEATMIPMMMNLTDWNQYGSASSWIMHFFLVHEAQFLPTH